ncbi:MAG: Crp/Fnr family transcriptional regulator [Elusimicrobiales bacterium]|nr:Crp/Fnr family transcriptional regulator [Elusimicrobiales bacterium]
MLEIPKLTQKEIKEISLRAKILKFNKNDVIFRKNDYGNFFFIIKKGIVRIITSYLGKTKIFADIGENEFFGELALLGIKYRTATALAITDTEILKIPKKVFEKHINKNKKFCLKLLKILAYRLKKADEEIEKITFYSLLGRVLMLLYSKYNQNKNMELFITQNELAAYLGSTRIPINRILNMLKRKEVITNINKGKIIINPLQLKKMINRKEIF